MFLCSFRSALHDLLKVNGWLLLLENEERKEIINGKCKVMDEVDHVDEVQINGVHFDYE